MLLYGGRGCGKSSASIELVEHLCEDGRYLPLRFEIGAVDPKGLWANLESVLFRSLDASEEIKRARATYLSKHKMDGMNALQGLFADDDSPFVLACRPSAAHPNGRRLVLIMDEFSTLYIEYRKAAEGSPRKAMTRDVLTLIKNMKEFPRQVPVVECVVALGTFDATDPTIGGIGSPFTNDEKLPVPNLTLAEVKSLFQEVREDQDLEVDEQVVESIHELTAGHAVLVAACGKAVVKGYDKYFYNLRSADGWRSFVAADGLAVMAFELPSLATPLTELKEASPYPLSLRKTLAQVLTAGPGAASLDSVGKDNARVLAGYGALRSVEEGVFEVASPLVRRILIREVLSVDYRHYVDKPLPREPSTGYLDGVGILQILGRVLVKEAYLVGRTKDADGKGATEVQVPHEVCYQLPLGLLLGQWAGAKASVSHEVTFTHSKDETKGKPDFVVVDLAQGERVKGKKIVLELSAHLADGERGKREAGGRYPNTVCGHVDKCEEQYAAAKDVVAVYCVNFTTQPEANCFKPEAALRDTTLVHVRHDEEGEVLGMLVLRPGETKWVRPKVPSIEDSKSVSVKSLRLEPDHEK